MHQPFPAQFADAIGVASVRPARIRREPMAQFLGAALFFLRLPARIVAIRRDMALLGAMSDRELSDIGLIRQDLWDAGTLPLGTHPGHLFTKRVASRKAGLSR
jgi:uncharacterized protein YjiS (DUF1127 family)